jgi:transposase
VDAADKHAALRRHHALNPRPHAVTDPAFTTGNPFFDCDDLVQVKYEMLRRVRQEQLSVSRAAATFGFSRFSFYAAQAVFHQAGLPGLVPKRPGPRRAHKLSDEVVDVLARSHAADRSLTATKLASLVQERFGVSVHPRSVERALARRKRGGPTT